MLDSYMQRWTRPRYVIVLLDQYGGMDKLFGAGMPNAGSMRQMLHLAVGLSQPGP